MSMIMRLAVFFFAFGLSLSTKANTGRVVEVEKQIKEDAVQFIQKMLDHPTYTIEVKVTPLKRILEQDGPVDNSLPFLDYQENEIVDEWDSPLTSIYTLMTRIKSAQVDIVFNDDVEIEDKDKFKTALLKEIGLVPGRDLVNISIEPMGMGKRSAKFFSDRHFIQDIVLASLILVGFGLILLTVTRLKPVKVENLGSNNSSSNNNTNAESVMSAPTAVNATVNNKGGGSGEFKGDLSISDPTQVINVIRGKINEILQSQTFPNLSDMMLLEELLHDNPNAFSFLIYEFPLEQQKQIFSYARNHDWLKGYADVGIPHKSCIRALDKMLRERNYRVNEYYEKLLIYAWRLDNKIDELIKSLDRSEALSVLYYLPKNLSIPVARKTYPGGWGEILSDVKIPAINKKDKIDNLINKAKELFPEYQYANLETFKNRKDLLAYLRLAEPSVEQEIYTVSGQNSDIWNVRAPFFEVFNCDENLRKEIFGLYDLGQWAMVCFNVSRSLRIKLDEIMSEKQRYLFGSILKQLDMNPPDLNDRGVLREEIAQKLVELKNARNVKTNETRENKQSVA
jgi:hypothetical protein